MNYKEKFWFNKIKENVIDVMQKDLDGEIFDTDDLARTVNEEVQSMCTYDDDCKEITQDLNFDVFSDDNLFNDQPQGWNHAGRLALDELWVNEANVTDILDEINFG